MAEYKNSYEGGTNAATITTGNSGGTSGDAFGFVTGSPVYDNTRSAHGSQSAKLTPVSGSACYMQLGAVGSGWGSTQFAARFYVYLTALPTTPYTLFRGNDDNSAIGVRLNIDNAGKLILGYNNGSTVTAWTAATAIPLNSWVRVEARIERSATAGVLAAAFYAGDGTTAIDSFSATGLNTGTSAITQAAFGKYGTDTSATTLWIDDPRVNTATTSFIGPVSNIPPTVTLTANQNVAAGATVSVAATAADNDGSIGAYAWTVAYSSDPSITTSSLTGRTTANVSFTAPSAAGHLVILQCAVTDDQGATTTATTQVRVPTTGGASILPGPGTGAAWTNSGSATSEGVALSDASDTTYVESPSYGATPSVRKFRLQPLTSRSDLAVTSRTYQDAAGGTLLVRLLDGITPRQQWTVAQSSTPADQTLTLSNPGAITDWGDLWVEYSVAA